MKSRCTPEQIAACPLQQHFADTHHLAYPKKKYRGQLEKTYRELPINKVQLCRYEHQEIHALDLNPPKPSRAEMLSAIASQLIRMSGDDEGKMAG